jgi:Ser/Thr protein kinase RdoA (MazF antagonist)
MSRWDELHCSILAEVPPPQCERSGFGIIHGDVNPSNYFADSSSETPNVFNLDQIQYWLYLYDLAGPIWSGSSDRNAEVPPSQVLRTCSLGVARRECNPGFL